MIRPIKEERDKTFVLEIVFAIFIFAIFALILFKYYGSSQKIEREERFVIIDYEQLQREADLITPVKASNKTAKSIFVLTYHVVSKNAPQDEYEISYDQFKKTMFALKSEGYETISLEDLYLFLGGEKELPEKSFLITFDDGSKVSYYNADPILKVLNYTAVLFVITGNSLEGNESVYYLNESELLIVQQTGRWDLESHTHKAHVRLPISESGEKAPALTNKLWIAEENRLETSEEFLNRVTNDLTKAKSLLESKFSKSVIAFALPYGDFGERGSNYEDAHRVIYEATTSLYPLVFYQFPIKNRFYKGNYPEEKQESYVVARLSADSFRTPEALLQRIEASQALDIPYYENSLNYDRWPRKSGEASFEKDIIIFRLREDSSDEAIFAYLDGSYLWKDYLYSLEINSSSASNMLLISRLKSPGDYVACSFRNDSVGIIGVENTSQKTIKREKHVEKIVNGTILSMSVSGYNVKCLINGKEVISAEAPNIPPNGGIGIKAEGFDAKDRKIALKNILITEVNSPQ